MAEDTLAPDIGTSVPDVTLTLSINPDLYTDLAQEAAMCAITPQRFASEAVEAVIAERRLDRSDRLKILRLDALGSAAEPSVDLVACPKMR